MAEAEWEPTFHFSKEIAMSPRADLPKKALPPAERFKSEIEKATAEGTPISTLLLQLTFGDAAKLKRDRNVSTEDLSFLGGEIRYLGVKVVEGGAASSALIVVQP